MKKFNYDEAGGRFMDQLRKLVPRACGMTNQQIAELLGGSVRQVRGVLTRLEAAGRIEVHANRGARHPRAIYLSEAEEVAYVAAQCAANAMLPPYPAPFGRPIYRYE